MNSQKIIHIITRLDRGGSADLLLKLAAAQRRGGREVAIISGRTVDPVADCHEYHRQTGIRIEFVNCLQREIHPWLDLQALWRLFRLLRQRRPDIVHLHTAKAGFIGRLAACAAGIKGVIYTTHGHIFHGYFNRLKTGIFIQMERLAAACGSLITTLSEAEKQDFICRRIAPAARIIPVPNGLDLVPFLEAKRGIVRKELGLDDKTPLIAWVGRFEPVKGPEIFLAVCQQLHQKYGSRIRAVMAGDGALNEKIRQERELRGLTDFLLLPGFRQDIVPLFTDLDLLVVTSINEGFGMVILEAMAAGKPVVAHNVGGIAEVVAEGETGFLVPVGDISAISDRLHLLLNDRKLYTAMSQAASQRAAAYSLTAMTNRFDSIYQQIQPASLSASQP
ncbi:MAG: hypothetical protein A2505_05705 [Deltaproteobacteria bacterium RIFOXYD12_FULL_55_16]|nr:MAG: hypothetical protein A2505_05705 [Deltaproteobacteria bacterium RIFOXYD12_FULL_55_16]